MARYSRLRAYAQFLVIGLTVSSCGCSTNEVDRPTPEASKQFLKLRGYNFDELSFFKAVAAADEIAVNGFLSAGINPNAKDENGDTALTAASSRGDLRIVKALLKGGADINAKGRNTWTALLLALHDERFEVADFLLSQPKLDVSAVTPEGMTALMQAVWHQREESVRKLLQLHSELNHRDNDGDTAVFGAAWFGYTTILRMLLDAGADPNIKNKLGGTALMWAASYGQAAAVNLLLEKGADPRIKDRDGVTAAGWAAKNGENVLATLLREAEKSGDRKQ
jgi:ankyrin repeat protein